MLEYKYVITFYSLVLLWIWTNRKKFEIQAKIIALYKTAVGIHFIDRVGTKYKEFIKVLGYIGIGAGFIGMVYISGVLVQGFSNLFLQPEAPPVFAPALPGVRIPGSPVFIPFWYGMISLFFVTVIHEFAHGIVAKAHGLKINSTGIAFFGPLIAAFVEPDEEQLKKKDDVVQYSIFAAGPFSNMIFAALALMLLVFFVSPLQSGMLATEGFSFYSITPFGPAFNASVPAQTVFTHLNGAPISSEEDFLGVLKGVLPGQEVLISGGERSYRFTAMDNPSVLSLREEISGLDKDNDKLRIGELEAQVSALPQALIGISSSQSGDLIQIHKSAELANPTTVNTAIYGFLDVSSHLLFWLFVLSFGIGVANLLPLGPVDGGRMLQILLVNLTQNKKKGNDLWAKISMAALILILLAVFIPIVRAVGKMLLLLFVQ